MSPQYLDHDLELVKANLSEEIQQLGVEFPLALIQAAQGVGQEPLPEGYEAQLIEVYRNGASDPSLVFHGENLVSCDPKFLVASQAEAVIVVEVDAIYRYVDIQGTEVLNTLGGFALPEMNPAAQAEAAISFLS